MVAVPTPYSWVNKEIPSYADMEDRTTEVMDFIMNPPMVRLRKTSAQSISTSTHTAISWNFVEVETVEMWNSTTPTRIKPSVPGWYVGTCGFSLDSNATGYREMNISKNGTMGELRVHQNAYTDGALTVTSRGNVFLTNMNGTTDYLEMQVWQNSGITLPIIVTAVENQPDFALRWVSAL